LTDYSFFRLRTTRVLQCLGGSGGGGETEGLGVAKVVSREGCRDCGAIVHEEDEDDAMAESKEEEEEEELREMQLLKNALEHLPQVMSRLKAIYSDAAPITSDAAIFTIDRHEKGEIESIPPQEEQVLRSSQAFTLANRSANDKENEAPDSGCASECNDGDGSRSVRSTLFHIKMTDIFITDI